MNRESFLKELNALNERFSSMLPELELTVRDPALGVEGYVVVWNTEIAAGSELGRVGKGGTRITPNVSLDEIKMLARNMALKNAAAGLPLGGAKSGLKADPDDHDFERRYRRFVSLVKPILRENGGIFGGFGFDIGARSEHPKWACDELGSVKSFTGKPLSMGGTDYDNEGIAGYGVAVAAKTILEQDGKDLKDVTYAVQGGGAMGAAVIKYFSQFGARLRHISGPICGATYVLDPKPTPELLESLSHRDHPTSISLLNQGGYKKLPIDDVIYQDVDVFFPCAVHHVITAANVRKITARYIVEGANNPCTPEAYEVLHSMGVKVVPDVIANPGGIIAAFVELTSKISPEENLRTKKNVIDAKALTSLKIEQNVRTIAGLCNELDVMPTQVARYLALKNIFRN